MSIESSLRRVEAIYEMLTTADVVDNTFGATWEVRDNLGQIRTHLQGKTGDISQEIRERLKQMLTNLEENRGVFAIPETWLIKQVYDHVTQIRKLVGD